MVLPLAAGLFLVRAGFGSSAVARLGLLVLWFGPVPPLYLPSIATVGETAPLLPAVTMAIALVAAWHANAASAASGRHGG